MEDGEYYEDVEAAVEEPVAEAQEESVETADGELQAEPEDDQLDSEVAPSTSDEEEGAR